MRTGFAISPAQQVARISGNGLVWFAIGVFVLNVFALIAAVVVDSFATRWLGTWRAAEEAARDRARSCVRRAVRPPSANGPGAAPR